MATKKAVNVYYRKLDRGAFPDGLTLQSALADAWSKMKENWQLRKMEIPTETGSQNSQFWNKSSQVANDIPDGLKAGLYGDICAFSADQMQALLGVAGATESITIKEERPGTGSEFLLGMAHWYVKGDHIFVIQSAFIKTSELEEYFNWILKKAGTLDASDNQNVVLQSVMDANQLGDLKEINKIQIGGTIAQKISPDRESVTEKKSVVGYAKELYTMFFSEEEWDDLVRNMPNDAELKATIEFQYKRLKRNVDATFLGGLCTALRDLPDSQIRTVGKNGIVSNQDLRLQMMQHVEKVHENGVILDWDDACLKMSQVYHCFLEYEQIADE